MAPKPQFPSYFTGYSFSIFHGGSSFTPKSLLFKLSQGSDFDSLIFNSYNIFQSCLFSWFLLSVKFPSQNSLMNSRLAGILHCLLDISTWMTNRHLNIFRSKIEFLVSPHPHKPTLLTVFPSQSMTTVPIEVLDQKITDHSWHPLFCYIKSVWESYGLYFQNISRTWLTLSNSAIPAHLWLEQSMSLAWISSIVS